MANTNFGLSENLAQSGIRFNKSLQMQLMPLITCMIRPKRIYMFACKFRRATQRDIRSRARTAAGQGSAIIRTKTRLF